MCSTYESAVGIEHSRLQPMLTRKGVTSRIIAVSVSGIVRRPRPPRALPPAGRVIGWVQFPLNAPHRRPLPRLKPGARCRTSDIVHLTRLLCEDGSDFAPYFLEKGKGRMDQFAPDQNIHPTGPLSSVKKRSVVVHEHSLEDGFWQSLKEIASLRQVSLCEIVNKIDAGRGPANLSSAIRLFVLDYYRQAAHCAVRETVFGT